MLKDCWKFNFFDYVMEWNWVLCRSPFIPSNNVTCYIGTCGEFFLVFFSSFCYWMKREIIQLFCFLLLYFIALIHFHSQAIWWGSTFHCYTIFNSKSKRRLRWSSGRIENKNEKSREVCTGKKTLGREYVEVILQ